jgi:succinylarginine dihydrolase
VLFCHEQAFEAPATFYAALTAALSGAVIIEVPASAVSLNDAITSYLFNSQLLTLVDESRPDGSMALILPSEAQENPRVAAYLNTLVAGNGPIRAVHFVAVRESMKNGGGPACLRLRVVADPEKVDPRFLMSPAKADRIEALVAAHWPEAIAPADLGDPALWRQCRSARAKLLGALGLSELI